ncbi:MAG: membrane protein insertion efficiency factor YidD [Faecalibacterium prausnitzii]
MPIRIYQYTLSPWIGRSCRFSPSCSNYTMQAILTHGCIKGILLARIAHCAVQSAGQMGLRPRAAARPLAKPRPQFTACKAVLHTAQAKGGKIEVFCVERSRVFKI